MSTTPVVVKVNLDIEGFARAMSRATDAMERTAWAFQLAIVPTAWQLGVRHWPPALRRAIRDYQPKEV